MIKVEIWRDIGGYEGSYQVSSYGNIKSLNFHNTGRPALLSQETTKLGYKRVTLSKDGKVRRFSIHRLVATAFISNPNNYPCINHKDENPSNNHMDNLEWCTIQYNTKYGSGISKMIATKNRIKSRSMELPVLQIGETNEIIQRYKSLHDAARKTGLCVENICATLKGRHKTAGGYRWRYENNGEN